MERYERMHAERLSCVHETKGIYIKRPGGGMMKWQPWCRIKKFDFCGRVRASVSTRKAAGARIRCMWKLCKCSI